MAMFGRILTISIMLSSFCKTVAFRTVQRSTRTYLPMHFESLRLFATKSKSKYQEASVSSWDDAKDGMTLVIVESPAKARTIQKFVDEDSFIIDSCAGHVRDLPKAGSDFEGRADLKKIIVLPELKINVADLGVDVRNNFEPMYVPLEGKAETLKRLKKLSEQCSRILLATDEDREGEAISWHLVEILKPKVPFKRAVFHEITKDAILKSFENPREIDMNIVQSQETRRILDRLTGYTISPVLWRYVAPGLSAGRVQSCGLYLITQRERKRWEFSESKYFSLKAAFTYSTTHKTSSSAPSGNIMISKLHLLDGQKVAGEPDFDGATGELKVLSKTARGVHAQLPIVMTKDIAHSVMTWLTSTESPLHFTIDTVTDKKATRKPPAPFITSTLQQDCSRRLNMNPSRCMSVAQELYEEGFITYMRTDSPALSATALLAARSFISATFGDDFLGPIKKVPVPKNSTATVIVDTETNEGGDDKDKDKKKSKKDIAQEEKENLAPKNAQNAHEAIRPAENEGKFKTPDETNLSGEKKLLYSLIYKRTLASAMIASQSLTKTYVISTEDSGSAAPFKSATFRTSETVTIFQGFKAALSMRDDGRYTHDSTDPMTYLKNLSVGQTMYLTEDKAEESDDDMDHDEDSDEENENENDGSSDVTDPEGKKEENPEDGQVASSILSKGGITAMQHVTRAPSRFSQASFVRELEMVGVGRPSTYAKIFQILKERGYVHVDGQTLVPTLKGMIVSAWVAKHFPDLVEPQFTASMEDSLDRISHGTEEKQKFLSKFYLGNPDEENSGLLSKVATKLTNQEIDHKISRSLTIPFLKDVGTVQLGRSGAFIEGRLEEAPTQHTDSPCESDVESGPGSTAGDVDKTYLSSRWKLPEAMQIDIREITREAVEMVMATETTMQGTVMGDDPVSGRPVLVRSGRFGRYMQIGLDSEKNRSTHSLPHWLFSSASLEDVLEFARLPRQLCMHLELNLPIIAEVAVKQLCVGIEGYPLRIPLPDGILVSQVTDEMARELLADTAAVLDSQRNLGDWNAEQVLVKQGRFGYYVRCGKLIAGLRKIDPSTVSLEDAIEMLITRGKPVGSKKKKTKKAAPKVKVAKSSAPRKQSGYQVYVAEVMKGGMKMGEAAATWKTMAAEEQQKYKDAAASTFEDVTSAGPSKTKTKSSVPRKQSGYQVYVAEVMKGGMKMGEAAATWKTMAAEEQQKYKDAAASTFEDVTSAGPSKTKTKSSVPRKQSGYQVYVAEVMKGGMKMGEAAATWKTMAAEEQQKYKDAAASTFEDVTSAGPSKTKTKSSVPRKQSGYQVYVAEVMKGGMKMGEAAATWKTMAAEEQQKYKDAAASTFEDVTSAGPSKTKTKSSVPRKQSGYQVYVAEVMKGGMKMGEAAATWKTMAAEEQQKYKDTATVAAGV